MRYLLSILFLFAINTPIKAGCGCMPKPIVDAIKDYEVIFVGRMIESRQGQDEKSESPYTAYIFEISTLYKGKVKGDTIELASRTAECDFKFNVGDTYIVYAGKWNTRPYLEGKVDKYLNADVCSRTTAYNQTEIDGIERYKKAIRVNK